MTRRTQLYFGFIALLAALAVAALYYVSPELPHAAVVGTLSLAVLAIFAEALSYMLPRSTRGSIASIPYLAMVVIAPNWGMAIAVLIVKSCTELVARVPRYKTVFNVAQHVLSLSVAALVYRALGGVSLLAVEPESLLHVTAVAGFPALVATTSSYLVNSVSVSIALGLINGGSFVTILRDIKGPTMGLDMLSAPLIFIFAWVYSAFGPVAAAAAWVPFLGLRHAHKTNLELDQMNQELLELMVKSLEARDPYTSGHSRRVKEYSMAIARAMGLAQREVERVGRAALLHDVGKIHEKYAPILSKMDKLTTEEWATMKEHPADGANLVATMTRLRDIVPAIRGHHENWDGTGYPDGLAGELIPTAARIVRFADTIDAMVSERPYRRPMLEAEVRAEVVRCRGTQFDPAITDRLLSSSLWTTVFRSGAKAPRDQILAVIGPSALASSEVTSKIHVRA